MRLSKNHSRVSSWKRERGRVSLALALGTMLPLAGCHSGSVSSSPPPVAPEQLRYDEGQAQLKRGEIAQARANFDTATRLNPGFAPAYFAETELDARMGSTAQAITDLETLHRASPTTPHLYCRLAELHSASGRFVEGVDAARLALKIEPSCTRAKTQFALQLIAANESKQAISMLQSVHLEMPENERVTLVLAQQLARRGQVAEAWQLMDSLPAAPTLAAQADYLRGWLFAEYGREGKRDDKQALDFLNRSLALLPDDGASNLEKGRLLLRAGKSSEALVCLQKARDHSPPSVELLDAVAEAQAQLKNPNAGRMKKSAQEFGKLVDELYRVRLEYIHLPDSRDTQVKLARLEATLGNGKDAEALLTEILKHNPNDAEALKLMTPGNDPKSP